MHKRIKKDYLKRKLFLKLEQDFLIYRFILYSTQLKKGLRNLIFTNIYNSKNYKTQIKNRCIITSRSRSVISSYKISRLTFRLLASNGLLSGIRKSSW
jgi:small subunit ribosomal protein S14